LSNRSKRHARCVSCQLAQERMACNDSEIFSQHGILFNHREILLGPHKKNVINLDTRIYVKFAPVLHYNIPRLLYLLLGNVLRITIISCTYSLVELYLYSMSSQCKELMALQPLFKRAPYIFFSQLAATLKQSHHRLKLITHIWSSREVKTMAVNPQNVCLVSWQ
jgi:hypothetical protein